MRRLLVTTLIAALIASPLSGAHVFAAASASLNSFPSSGTTWKDRFQVTKVPINKFQAHYFNTKSGVLAKKEVVDSIDLRYIWNEGKGFKIYSEDFGAYWIGQFTTSRAEVMQLDTFQSWAQARVIIDGRVVHQGGESVTTHVKIPKGAHTLEVEYENNWHTTSFTATLRPLSAIPPIARGKISSSANSSIWYAGVYESSAFDRTIRLTTSSKEKSPKVLVLSSFEPVRWDLAGLKKLPIESIIVSSFNPGARLLHAPKKAKTYTATVEAVYEGECYSQLPCDTHPGLWKASSEVASLTGKPISGFVGKYDAETLVLPGELLR